MNDVRVQLRFADGDDYDESHAGVTAVRWHTFWAWLSEEPWVWPSAHQRSTKERR